jgi:prepilin-type N-terminal cleavage/methylation domain-containing protein
MKMKIKFNKGYTLIELLTSIAILAAIGSIIAGVLTFSLRGSNKITVVENIRQNGSYALSQISKDIIYAQPFNGITTGINAAHLAACPPATPVTEITMVSSAGVMVRYTCNGATLTANGSSIINSTSLSLTGCSFTCAQADVASVPIIGISFWLEPRNATGLAENNANSKINFKTSVTMRNYKK